MYRPCALFIDIDREWKTDVDDPLYSDLNKHFIQQQISIGGRLLGVSGQPLQPHPTNPFCVYSPWYMVDVAADSGSDWEMDDHGTGIFRILEKYRFQFGGASALFNVGDNDKMTTLMISFEHEEGPSLNWKNENIVTSVAQEEYDARMAEFKKVEDQWNQQHPDPNKSDSDESMMDEDSDEDSNDSSNDGSYGNYKRSAPVKAPVDERAEAMFDLDLDPTSNPTKAEIRKAYRKKAKEVHSDRGGNDEAMKRVNNARDILLPNKFKPVLKF